MRPSSKAAHHSMISISTSTAKADSSNNHLLPTDKKTNLALDAELRLSASPSVHVLHTSALAVKGRNLAQEAFDTSM